MPSKTRTKRAFRRAKAKSEGGHKGVSFSGADIAYANHYKEPIYVDAGDKQFMIMPTLATKTDAATINKEWDAEFQKQLTNGESIQKASAAASNSVAKKNTTWLTTKVVTGN